MIAGEELFLVLQRSRVVTLFALETIVLSLFMYVKPSSYKLTATCSSEGTQTSSNEFRVLNLSLES